MSACTWCTDRLAPRDQDKVAEGGRREERREGGREGRREGEKSRRRSKVDCSNLGFGYSSHPFKSFSVPVWCDYSYHSSFFSGNIYIFSPFSVTGTPWWFWLETCVCTMTLRCQHNINMCTSLFGTKRKWHWVLWVKASHKHTFPPKQSSSQTCLQTGAGLNRGTGTVFRWQLQAFSPS